MTTWTASMRAVEAGGRRWEKPFQCQFFKFCLWQVSNPLKKEEEGAVSKPASMFQMMNHIQSLISMAVENAKQEEKSISHQKSESMSFLQQSKDQIKPKSKPF